MNPYNLVAHFSMEISHASTSAVYIDLDMTENADVLNDHTKVLYVRVRDEAGPRAGYFYGSDTFMLIIGITSENVATRRTPGAGYSFDEDGIIHAFTPSSTASTSAIQGVAAYSYSESTNLLRLVKRFTSSGSRTIDGTFSIDVFTLDFPDGYPSPLES